MTRQGRRAWLVAPAFAVLALLGGCAEFSSVGRSVSSTVTGWFSSSSKPAPKPLEPITSPIAGRQVWSQRIDSVRYPLTVAVNNGVFTLAGTDGTVVALQADTGREVWRASVGAKLSAGVGSDGKYAAVVTANGELVVLEGGQVKWRKALGTRVATAPFIAGERVFVLGVDRAVRAFDERDGTPIWTLKRPGDPLTLAQTGVLSAYKDTLVVGQGPRMAGVDPLRGSVRWEVAVGSPRGANEIERLADLVGPTVRVGELLCARSFQAAVGCVNGERGAIVWTKNTGGTEGIAADDQFLISADASDRITAWKMANGDTAWNSEKLMYRDLTTPIAVGQTVVFGDSQGTLHWLARDTGAARLRLPTDSSGVAAPLALSGTTLLAVTHNGGVFAFRPE